VESILDNPEQDRARVFLDTDAASKMGRMDETEKRGLRRYLEARFSWVVSPLTFAELAIGRSRGTDWDKSSRGLHELGGQADPPAFLPFPTRAVQLVVTGRASPHLGWEPKDLERHLRAAVEARSRADMDRVLDSAFGKIMEEGETLHQERLEEARATTRAANALTPAPERWAARVAAACVIEPTPEHLAAILQATDASMRLDTFLWKESRNTKGHDFQKNVDDWVDSQQLLLLAFPDVHFLTADEKLRKKVEGSRQSHRVLSFEKARTAAGLLA
jgi:hypothetical protein